LIGLDYLLFVGICEVSNEEKIVNLENLFNKLPQKMHLLQQRAYPRIPWSYRFIS